MEEALPSVELLQDERFSHFYDQNQVVGRYIANSVGWIDKTAWDIYLFYQPGLVWNEHPPEPSFWMHQLTDEWISDDKYRTGVALKNELTKSIENLIV